MNLSRNPALGVGTIRHTPAERGVFSVEELESMFPPDSRGPWSDLQICVAFLLPASPGMGRGEVPAGRHKDSF